MMSSSGRVSALALVAAVACLAAGCSAAPTVRLEPVSGLAREVPLSAPVDDAAAPPTGSQSQADFIDSLSEVSYWDLDDGTTWRYRIYTSDNLQVEATRSSTVAGFSADSVDVGVTWEYAFPNGDYAPVVIDSVGESDVDGTYREPLQLTFDQALRQAPDPVLDAEITLPGQSLLPNLQPEAIDVGPLGTGDFEEYERSTRTIVDTRTTRITVLDETREVRCFTEVRSGTLEGPSGVVEPFERRAEMCFALGIGLVSSQIENGPVSEYWTLIESTSDGA